ncbi:MAG: YbaB/EbfC family nucleoid-associated protein [bacterium]|nr:YbaB/EbfC family nucleoid-associated protein [bacterium]
MLGNISQILEMKKKAEELKNKLEAITITETINGITVDCNGNRKILSIHIDAAKLSDKTQLEDHLVQTINKALENAEKANMAEVGAMAGGMPGLMGLFGK